MIIITYFTELRQKEGIYIQKLVLQIRLPSLNSKLFETKTRKIGQPTLGQTDYKCYRQERSCVDS